MGLEPTLETISCLRIPNEPFERTGFVRLDKNENTLVYFHDFVNRMLESITPAIFVIYPEPFFQKKRLASYLNIDEDNILLTSGSDVTIKNCFEAFMEKGDRLVRPDPTYTMVGVYANLFGANEIIVWYNL